MPDGQTPPCRLGWLARFTQQSKSSFIRSAGVLVGGTAFAQALMVLALPVLTRLYTPDDFSMLAIYASLLGMTSVIACLRFDIAIPIPKQDTDAANLLALALTFSALVSSVIALLVLTVPGTIVQLLNQHQFEPYLWLVPLGVFLASAYNALQFWSVRRKRFPLIARTRMTQAVGGVSTQIGFGIIGAKPLGLLIGQAISSGAGVLGLGVRVAKQDRKALKHVRPSEMRRLFRQYSHFPKYSTFEAFANSAGIQLPIIMIAALAVGPEAGFVMLAMRVMQAPMALIGSAVSQVYLSEAPEEYREGRLGDFTTRILGGLLKVGVGPLVFAGIIAPEAFALVFGEEWKRAGQLVQWMTPWFILQFLTSPLSMALHITGNQKRALLLQVIGLGIRIGSVLLAAKIGMANIAEFFALSGFVFYAIYFLVIKSIALMELKDLVAKSSIGFMVITGWIAMALIVRKLIPVA